MLQIRRIIHHTHEMYRVVLCEMQNLVPCPDLFAFVGRVWDTVRKIQDVHADISMR